MEEMDFHRQWVDAPKFAAACLKGRSLLAGDERRRPRENRCKQAPTHRRRNRGRVELSVARSNARAWSGMFRVGFWEYGWRRERKVRPAYATPDRIGETGYILAAGIKDRDRALALRGRERDSQSDPARSEKAPMSIQPCILKKIDGGSASTGFALRNAETGIGGVAREDPRIANADTVGARDGHGLKRHEIEPWGPRNACSGLPSTDSGEFTAVNGQEDTGPRSLPARASAR